MTTPIVSPIAHAVDRLDLIDRAECWRLLGIAHVGRIAIAASGGVEIFPINYLLSDHTLLFRAASGTWLSELTEHPSVALEIDGEDSRWHWSVVVHGTAERLSSDVELVDSGVLDALPADTDDSFRYLRFTPDVVTGHRTDRTSSAAAAWSASSGSVRPRRGRDGARAAARAACG